MISEFNSDQKWITDLEIHKCIQCTNQVLTSCDYLSWQQFHHSFPFSLWMLRGKFEKKGISLWKALDFWYGVGFLLPQTDCVSCLDSMSHELPPPLWVTLNTVQTELSLLKTRHETSRSQFKQADKVKYKIICPFHFIKPEEILLYCKIFSKVLYDNAGCQKTPEFLTIKNPKT